MVKVTRLNGQEVYINADLILFLEKSPDTVLTLENGKKIMVKNPSPRWWTASWSSRRGACRFSPLNSQGIDEGLPWDGRRSLAVLRGFSPRFIGETKGCFIPDGTI